MLVLGVTDEDGGSWNGSKELLAKLLAQLQDWGSGRFMKSKAGYPPQWDPQPEVLGQS